MTQTQPSAAFPTLQGHNYANLTTFRKSGVAVETPVWFAEENGKLYVMTMVAAGKTKRIRNNPRVSLAPCTQSGKALGPAVEAVARILPPEEEQHARQPLDRKYGLTKKLFDIFFKLRRQQQIFFEITPA